MSVVYDDPLATSASVVTFTIVINGCVSNEITLTSGVTPNPYEYIIGDASTDLSGVFDIKYTACALTYSLNDGTFDTVPLTFDTSSGVISVFLADTADNNTNYGGTTMTLTVKVVDPIADAGSDFVARLSYCWRCGGWAWHSDL